MLKFADRASFYSVYTLTPWRSHFACSVPIRHSILLPMLSLTSHATLQDAIDQGQFQTSPKPDAPLNIHMIAHVFKQLASGLKALHDAGILHCDISGGESATLQLYPSLMNFEVVLCLRVRKGRCARQAGFIFKFLKVVMHLKGLRN